MKESFFLSRCKPLRYVGADCTNGVRTWRHGPAIFLRSHIWVTAMFPDVGPKKFHRVIKTGPIRFQSLSVQGKECREPKKSSREGNSPAARTLQVRQPPLIYKFSKFSARRHPVKKALRPGAGMSRNGIFHRRRFSSLRNANPAGGPKSFSAIKKSEGPWRREGDDVQIYGSFLPA